jgi:hypothetical protein
MDNLYYLLMETPDGNLSAGMRSARVGVLSWINHGGLNFSLWIVSLYTRTSGEELQMYAALECYNIVKKGRKWP